MDPTRTMAKVGFNNTDENINKLTLDNILYFINKNKILLKKNDNLVLKTNDFERNSKSKRTESVSTINRVNDFERNSKLPLINNNDLFQKFDTAPFTSFTSYDLASIDMFYDITDHSDGIIAPQLFKLQNYVISGSLETGLIEYIQYRNPFAYIYFLRDLPLYDDNLDYSRIQQITSNNSNNEYSDLSEYTKTILRIEYGGVDVYISQDHTSDVDLIYQIILMLSTLRLGGQAIIKIKFNNFGLDIFTLLSGCFDKLSLFKPSTLGLYNNEYYVIAKFYRKSESLDTIRFLKDLTDQLDYSNNVMNILNSQDQQVLDYFKSIKTSIELEKIQDSIDTYIPVKIKLFLNVTSN